MTLPFSGWLHRMRALSNAAVHASTHAQRSKVQRGYPTRHWCKRPHAACRANHGSQWEATATTHSRLAYTRATQLCCRLLLSRVTPR